MNTRLYFLVLFFLLHIHCIAQTAFFQQELDCNGNISYAAFRNANGTKSAK